MYQHRVAYLIARLAGASAPASVVSGGHFTATTYHKAPRLISVMSGYSEDSQMTRLMNCSRADDQNCQTAIKRLLELHLIPPVSSSVSESGLILEV